MSESYTKATIPCEHCQKTTPQGMFCVHCGMTLPEHAAYTRETHLLTPPTIAPPPPQMGSVLFDLTCLISCVLLVLVYMTFLPMWTFLPCLIGLVAGGLLALMYGVGTIHTHVEPIPYYLVVWYLNTCTAIFLIGGYITHGYALTLARTPVTMTEILYRDLQYAYLDLVMALSGFLLVCGVVSLLLRGCMALGLNPFMFRIAGMGRPTRKE